MKTVDLFLEVGTSIWMFFISIVTIYTLAQIFIKPTVVIRITVFFILLFPGIKYTIRTIQYLKWGRKNESKK